MSSVRKRNSLNRWVLIVCLSTAAWNTPDVQGQALVNPGDTSSPPDSAASPALGLRRANSLWPNFGSNPLNNAQVRPQLSRTRFATGIARSNTGISLYGVQELITKPLASAVGRENLQSVDADSPSVSSQLASDNSTTPGGN
eukprot:7035475-Pyramimonas_sp.AAC.1